MDTPTAAPDLHELYARALDARGFQSDPAQLAAVDCLDDLRKRLMTAHGRPAIRWRLRRSSRAALERGVYLWGGVGRGKTWLMDLFFQSLPFHEARRRHFHRFMHDAQTALRGIADRTDPLDLIAERIARDARVLCFDELAVADIADAMILGGMLQGLLRRGVALVATSNLPPRDLYRDGLQRERFLPAIELIERHTAVIEVAGSMDYRLRRLAQAGTYLSAGAPDTGERLERLFGVLGDHGASNEDSLEIEGRSIPVVRCSDAAVWFDFDALCAGPRSTQDYIEIAREFGSVILSNVPVLDEIHENEARRFIDLIDELYDRSVHLIVSAAAPPAALYRGERLAFEFRRTASRLMEMQSTDYLAREHRP
ncbi:MAG: cell division protein ZapE [Steroidobacteraceae bacterium]